MSSYNSRIKPTETCTSSVMTRRQFCATASAAVAGIAFRSSRPAYSAPISSDDFRLNYILAAPLYGTTPLADVLPEVHKTGAAAIDIWSMPHGNHREQIDRLGLDQVEILFEKYRVRLGAITRYDLGPYRICEELPLLERLGGKLLICGPARKVALAKKSGCKNSLKA